MLYLPKADPPGLKNFEHENACFVHLVTKTDPITVPDLTSGMIQEKIRGGPGVRMHTRADVSRSI